MFIPLQQLLLNGVQTKKQADWSIGRSISGRMQSENIWLGEIFVQSILITEKSLCVNVVGTARFFNLLKYFGARYCYLYSLLFL